MAFKPEYTKIFASCLLNIYLSWIVPVAVTLTWLLPAS